MVYMNGRYSGICGGTSYGQTSNHSSSSSSSSMTIFGKHYVTKLSYAGDIDFALYLHFLFKSAVSAAFAAHSISAVFIA